MKCVCAFIRPLKLDDVKKALKALDVPGITISEVRGSGHQKGYTETWRGDEISIDLLPKIKVETFVPDEKVEEVVKAIIQAARTGEIGDGKIIVTPIEEAMAIRTGLRGEEAI